MTDPPLVTALIPTYERRDTVDRAVASVLGQPYPWVETIVVDDGSTDGTADALARRFGKQITVIRRENGGVSAARNTGIDAARGELIAFLDSDNWWLPHHLDVVTRLFDLQPDAILASTSRGFRIGGDERLEDARAHDHFRRALLGNHVGYVSSVAVRRETLVAAGGFDERMRSGEDADMFFRLALRGFFVLVQRPTFVRTRSPDSLRARGARRGDYLETYALSVERVLAELHDSCRADAGELLEKTRGRQAFVRALRALDEHDDRTVREQLDRACALLPELSDYGAMVVRTLQLFMPRADDPAELLRMFTVVAEAWPDQRHDAAALLRSYAVWQAARLGRPRLAARHARRIPARGLLAVGRNVPHGLYDLRRAVEESVNRRRQPPHLDPLVDVADDHGAGGDDRAPADGDVVTNHRRHADEDVPADPDVARDVGARIERDELRDLGVVSDEHAPAQDGDVADRRVRADHGTRPDH